MHSTKLNFSNLPEWGTKVFVLKENGGKLEPKTDEGRWLGYSDESKGHRIYWPRKHHVTMECNITFEAPILITSNDTPSTNDNGQGTNTYS